MILQGISGRFTKSPSTLTTEEVSAFLTEIGSVSHSLQIRKLMSLHDLWWLSQIKPKLLSLNADFISQTLVDWLLKTGICGLSIVGSVNDNFWERGLDWLVSRKFSVTQAQQRQLMEKIKQRLPRTKFSSYLAKVWSLNKDGPNRRK